MENVCFVSALPAIATTIKLILQKMPNKWHVDYYISIAVHILWHPVLLVYFSACGCRKGGYVGLTYSVVRLACDSCRILGLGCLFWRLAGMCPTDLQNT